MDNFAKVNIKQQLLTMWLIWFAILSGLFIIYQFASPKAADDAKEVEQVYSIFTILGTVTCVISMIIRWLMIPRLKSPSTLLQAMVLGLAMAEVAGFIGIFVVPADQITERSLLLSASIASIILSAPIYAKKQLGEIKKTQAA